MAIRFTSTLIAKRRRMRPLEAFRCFQRLVRDREDTEQVFHIIRALYGRSLQKGLLAFATTPDGAARLRERVSLPAVLDQRDWLRALPSDSVGHAYLQFMETEGLTAAGLVAESEKFGARYPDWDDDLKWYGNRLRDTHDLYHVLTGYGRNPLGEAVLLAFTNSMDPNPGLMFISFMGCREIASIMPRSAPVMAAMMEGRRLGKRAEPIAAQDIVSLMGEPLADARRRLGIGKPETYLRAYRDLQRTRGVSDPVPILLIRHAEPAAAGALPRTPASQDWDIARQPISLSI